MPQTQFTLGAFAIIFDEHERVLISHRRDMDAWNLPGGGVESGETPVEAVIREVAEETGLDVTVDRLVGVYTNARRDDIVFTFVCHVTAGHSGSPRSPATIATAPWQRSHGISQRSTSSASARP